MSRFLIRSVVAGLLAFNVLPLAGAEDPASVLIVVNDVTPPEEGTGDTGASVYVGEYYAAARGIPFENILHIRTGLADVPRSWDVFRIWWSNFDSDIRKPIKEFLESRDLKQKIKYIVTTYGVPTHVARYPGTNIEGLSVDAYLAGLYQGRDVPASRNPLYRNPSKLAPHWTSGGLDEPVYLVARLDGPSAVLATALVDRALTAEKGIDRQSGTGYFDFQHRAGAVNDPYVVADRTVMNVYELCVSAGMRCELNDQSVTGSLIKSAPETLWAWGWYSGATVNDVYTFAPGAVGAQLTSYTANTVREMGLGTWAPLWIERGITATWGATYEPYLWGYAMGDVLLANLWNGYSFGEAAYIASPRLQWMMVFLGDPLYTVAFNPPPAPPEETP